MNSQNGSNLVNSDGLDDYNPFTPDVKKDPNGGRPAPQPAAAQPPPPPPPSSNTHSSGTVADESATAINIGIEELEKRQKQLGQQSAELDKREKEQSRLLSSQTHVNNWPPFPACCPCRSCFFQDINGEMPTSQAQSTVRLGYYLWVGQLGVLFFNLLAALAYFIESGSTMSGSTFGSALLVLLLLPPLSYLAWFRPLYKAFRNDSSASFFVFFITMSVQALITIIQALGIYYLGSCGWLNGLMTLKTNRVVALIMLCIAALFSLLAVTEVYLLGKVHRMYRGGGGSLGKARGELGAQAGQSEAVRDAAGSLLRSATATSSSAAGSAPSNK